MTDRWTEDHVPRQVGRTFVVTGANAGIGFEASCLLAERGAHVVMACRNAEKAQSALDLLRKRATAGNAEVLPLDLADTENIHDFAKALSQRHDRIDGLINNAGVMALARTTTTQGFEMHLGINHLGHYALTCLLLPLITDDGRIVTVSSEVHRAGRMHFDDLMLEKRYGRWKAYLQSKLANVLFTRELQRRLDVIRPEIRAATCHPGYSATELQSKSGSAFEAWFMRSISNRVLAQSARMGALPALRAACDPNLPKNAYVGPTGFFHTRGYPKLGTPSPAGQDDASGARLWQISMELTGLGLSHEPEIRTHAPGDRVMPRVPSNL